MYAVKVKKKPEAKALRKTIAILGTDRYMAPRVVFVPKAAHHHHHHHHHFCLLSN